MLSAMVAGDPSQTTRVQMVCRTTQKRRNVCNIIVICTDVVWLLSPAVARVPHANEAICKLTSWNVHKSTININSPRGSGNSP